MPRARARKNYDLGPHLIAAPPPWLAERELPFEPEDTPDVTPCRSCARKDRSLEVELIAAYQSLHSLEELLVWLCEEHEWSNRWREESEREIEELKALLGEFEQLSRSEEEVLANGRAAVSSARERVTLAEQGAVAERKRASRLAAELKKHKGKAATAPAHRVRPVSAARPEPTQVDDAALAFAAAEAGEADSRLLSVELELKNERLKVARFARYAGALEGRLRQVSEAREQPARELVASGD